MSTTSSVRRVAAVFACICVVAVCHAVTESRPRNVRANLASTLRAVAADGTVFVTTSTCAYADFTMNWATHMLQLHLTNFIVIAEDENVYQFLTNTTDLKGHVLRSSEFHRPFEAHGAHAFVEYDSKGFSWCSRPHYLLSVVRHGYTAIWIDSDAVLLRSPMQILPDLYDIVVTEDSDRPQGTSVPCSCFIVARPRPAKYFFL